MKLKCEMKQLSNEDKKNRKLSVDVQLSAPTVVTDYQFNIAYEMLCDNEEASIDLIKMKALSDTWRMMNGACKKAPQSGKEVTKNAK